MASFSDPDPLRSPFDGRLDPNPGGQEIAKKKGKTQPKNLYLGKKVLYRKQCNWYRYKNG
jgi:hypothetical protein